MKREGDGRSEGPGDTNSAVGTRVESRKRESQGRWVGRVMGSTTVLNEVVEKGNQGVKRGRFTSEGTGNTNFSVGNE